MEKDQKQPAAGPERQPTPATPELPDDTPPDDAFEDAFDEATGPKATKPTQPPADEPSEEAEQTPETAAPGDETAPETAKTPAAEPAPQDKLAAAPTETQQPPAKPPPPSPAASPEDFLTAALDRVAAEDTPATIPYRGKSVEVGQFLKDFPEVDALTTYKARRMVQEALRPVAAMVPSMRDLAARQHQEAFFDAVSKEVPEARAIAGSQEFQAWLAAQPKPLQAIASQDDPESAVFVLRQYASAKPPAKTAERPAAPSPEFERRRLALAGAMPPKAAVRKAGGPDPDDFDAAFEEAVAEADQQRRRR